MVIWRFERAIKAVGWVERATQPKRAKKTVTGSDH